MSKIQTEVARHKATNPELYCPRDRCLWRTGGGFCPRHQAVREAAAVDILVRRDDPTQETP